MATNYKVVKDNDAYILDYKRASKPFEFRYKMLKNTLKYYGQGIIIVDTNAGVAKQIYRIDEVLAENGINYRWYKIKSSKNKLFSMVSNGFKKEDRELSEKMILADVNYENFTEEVFSSCFRNYDIALGLGSKMSIEELVHEYRADIDLTFFKQEFFDNFVYDSIVFTRFRSTFNAEEIALGELR